MQAIRAMAVPSTRRPVVGRTSRVPVRIVASVDWALEPDTMPGQAIPIVMSKLWSSKPHRCLIGPSGMDPVTVAAAFIDPTFSTFNSRAAGGATQLVKAHPDYSHGSKAHSVLVIEGDNADLKDVTVCLQRGDRSSADVKLNGKPLKVEKKVAMKPGDRLQLPGVEYRVTRSTSAHA